MSMTFSSSDNGNGSLAVCTTGTEAPTLAATDGLALGANSFGFPIGSLTLYYEASGALTAGSLLCYLRNRISGVWSRAPRLDIPIAGGANSEASEGFAVALTADRIAYAPSGLGQAGNLYILGQPAKGF